MDENSVSLHFAVSERMMNQESALKVYKYYNNSGLPLYIDNTITGNFEISNENEDNQIKIKVNMDKNMTPDSNNFTLENYYDITNAVMGHEFRGHYKRYMELGPYEYDRIPSSLREIYAINAQIKDPSWIFTTPKYRNGVLGYYKQQLKKSK
jgi:hypothetical protein